LTFHGPAMGRAMAPDGAIKPAAKFSFWSSMADLMRLVMRSRAQGLKTRLVIALTLVMIGKWAGVSAPLLMRSAIDQFGRPSPTFIAFAGFAAIFVLLQFVANTAPYMRDSIFTPVSQSALARSAVEAFAHSLSLSLDFHQSKQTGGLSRVIDRGSRSTDFLLRSVVFNLGPTVIELLMACYVLTTNFDSRLAMIALVTIVVYVVFTFSISNWRIKHRREWNEADSEAMGLAVDSFLNFETIKAFGSEARAAVRYEDAMARYANAAVKANTSLQLLNAVQSVVLRLGMITIILLAGWDVMHGRMTVGGITACILILSQVYQPLNMLGMNYREIRQSFIDMEQLIALMAVEPGILDRPDARALPPASADGAELVFEDVGFQHAARSVGLTDVSFRVAPGTTTALVGPSGSGKTTIVRLALRLLDPQSGRITLDGVDLREVKQAAVRQAIALVPQDVALFNDTLYANIAFGRPGASEAEVWAAAEAAELSKFIENLPNTMQTRVGERGLKLSGGERQRVGLARALLANPRLLVLDEATSALDGRTEAAIQATLRKVRQGRTTLVIAHRLSTIADADEILVIRRGRIVENGRHDDLIAHNGEYAALWRRQTRDNRAGGFEMAAADPAAFDDDMSERPTAEHEEENLA
jgi:ABC-type transport system involved in Fe-S cluster assembly fused permease/ATPase subunit